MLTDEITPAEAERAVQAMFPGGTTLTVPELLAKVAKFAADAEAYGAEHGIDMPTMYVAEFIPGVSQLSRLVELVATEVLPILASTWQAQLMSAYMAGLNPSLVDQVNSLSADEGRELVNRLANGGHAAVVNLPDQLPQGWETL